MAIPQTITAYLAVVDASKAIDFYKAAFGAEELMRFAMPDGTIGHAELKIGDSIVYLAEENEEWLNPGPKALGGTSVRICLEVEDCDTVTETAVAAGAEILMPLEDQFYGFRQGRLGDPFGHQWVVSTNTENLTEEQMQQRFDEMMATGGGDAESQNSGE